MPQVSISARGSVHGCEHQNVLEAGLPDESQQAVDKGLLANFDGRRALV
jgi:hypothetical protein